MHIFVGYLSSPCGYAVRHTNNTGRRQVGIHFRDRRFPTEVVKRIERAKTPAARQRIAHEVHRPARVDGGLRLLTDGRSPFLFATHVQPRLSINPVDAFVVPCMPLTTRHGKAFGKSASWVVVRQPNKAAVTRRRLAGEPTSTHICNAAHALLTESPCPVVNEKRDFTLLGVGFRAFFQLHPSRPDFSGSGPHTFA